MATSTGKTLALVVLIIIILFFGLRASHLLLGPLGVLGGITTGIFLPFNNFFCTSIYGYPMLSKLFPILLIGLWICLIVWVYRDAESRGMNGVLWALLVLFGSFIGLLIYLIIRSDGLPSLSSRVESKRVCPSCEKSVIESYAFCPFCGSKMEAACPECMNPTKPGWKLCPHCGTKLKTDDAVQ